MRGAIEEGGQCNQLGFWPLSVLLVVVLVVVVHKTQTRIFNYFRAKVGVELETSPRIVDELEVEVEVVEDLLGMGVVTRPASEYRAHGDNVQLLP